MLLLQPVDRRLVHGGVLADRGVGAPAGLESHDPVQGQHAVAGEDLGVLDRVDVVGDRRHGDVLAQRPGEAFDQLGLARAHRSADPDLHCRHVVYSSVRSVARFSS